MHNIFLTLAQPYQADVMAFNLAITTCCNYELWQEALTLFESMSTSSIEADACLAANTEHLLFSRLPKQILDTLPATSMEGE